MFYTHFHALTRADCCKPMQTCVAFPPPPHTQGTFEWPQMLDALHAGCNTPASIRAHIATSCAGGNGTSGTASAAARQAPLALSQLMKKLKEWVEAGLLERVARGQYRLCDAAAAEKVGAAVQD